VGTLSLSFQAVLPLMLMLAAGFFLRRRGVLGAGFAEASTPAVYTVLFPSYLFLQMLSVDLHDPVRPVFLLYLGLAVLLPILLLMALVPRRIRHPARCGAFIQGAFRTNPVLMGAAVMQSLFPVSELSTFFMSILVTVPMNTLMTGLVFARHAGDGRPPGLPRLLCAAFFNPFIIAIALGILLNYCRVALPGVLMTVLRAFSAAAAPVAMLSLGSQTSLSGFREDGGHLAACVGIKMLLIPVLGVAPMFFLGFSGIEILTAFFTLGTPGAITGYSISRRMGSDHRFTGEVISLSSLVYCVTAALAIALFKALGVL